MKRKISPDMRLMIASQQMAGMQAPGYVNEVKFRDLAKAALSCADVLIAVAGCEVSDEPAPTHGIQLATDKTIMLHQQVPADAALHIMD